MGTESPKTSLWKSIRAAKPHALKVGPTRVLRAGSVSVEWCGRECPIGVNPLDRANPLRSLCTIRIFDHGELIDTIEEGVGYDGMSAPAAVMTLLGYAPMDPGPMLASLPHDRDWRGQRVSKPIADAKFYAILKAVPHRPRLLQQCLALLLVAAGHWGGVSLLWAMLIVTALSVIAPAWMAYLGVSYLGLPIWWRYARAKRNQRRER